MSHKRILWMVLVLMLPACSTPVAVSHTEHPEAGAVIKDEHETIYAEIINKAKITILGEMHGNTNSPSTALEMATDVLDVHGAVTVGLELPVQDQATLDAYLNSAGSAEDRQTLIASRFWSEEYADGRSSVAMVELLDALRQLKQAGKDVDVLAFDGRTGTRGNHALELEMAEPVIAWAQAHPERKMVLLVGNFHAQLAPIQMGEESLEPMALYITTSVNDVISIVLRYDGGSTMARTEAGFEPLRLAPHQPPGQRGLRTFEGLNDAYHFEWALGPASPSMPANSTPPS